MNIAMLLRLVLPTVLELLQLAVKNPSSVASETAILGSVYDSLGVILGKTPAA